MHKERFAPCEGIRMSRGICKKPENSACGIRSPGLWNPEYSYENYGILLKTEIQTLSSTDRVITQFTKEFVYKRGETNSTSYPKFSCLWI